MIYYIIRENTLQYLSEERVYITSLKTSNMIKGYRRYFLGTILGSISDDPSISRFGSFVASMVLATITKPTMTEYFP